MTSDNAPNDNALNDKTPNDKPPSVIPKFAEAIMGSLKIYPRLKIGKKVSRQKKMLLPSFYLDVKNNLLLSGR